MKRIPGTLALALMTLRLCSGQEAPDTLAAAGGDPEDLSFSMEGEESALAELERLSAMMDEPIDLKGATESELLLIPGIDRVLARVFLDSLSERRSVSAADLGRIRGVSRADLGSIMPFITTTGARATSQLSGSMRMRAEAVLSQKPGEPLRALGNRWKTLCRITLERAGPLTGLALKAALVAEKDAGEPRALDHLSAFVWLRPTSGFELTAGDFAIEGALGTVFGAWGPRSQASAWYDSHAWKSLVARPTASASESGGLRGVLAAYRSESFEAVLFYSNRAVHARLDSSSIVTSFYQAGLFRTASEEALRSRTRERALGGRLSIQIARPLRFGASASQSVFLHRIDASSLARRGERGYWAAGVDALVTVGRAELAAEFARDGWRRTACAAAMDIRLSAELRAHAAVRRAEPGFVSLHAFQSEASAGGSTVALGLRWDLAQGVRWDIFTDESRTAGPGPGGLALSEGRVTSRLVADVPGPVALTIQAGSHRSEESVTSTDELGRSIRVIGKAQTQSARIGLTFEPSARLSLECACDFRAVRPGSSQEAERGLAFTHTLWWQMAPWIEFEIRATSYGTESYASRLYQWERSVRGAMIQTLLYGSGVRYSASLRLGSGGALAAEVFFSETDRSIEKETAGRPMLELYERRMITCQFEARF